MISTKKLFTAVLALSAGLAVAACNDEKSTKSDGEKPTTAEKAAAAVDAAKEKAKDVAEKVEDKAKEIAEKAAPKIEAAKEKVKELADKVEDKIEAKVDAAKEKMKDLADKAGDKIEAAKEAAQPATKEAEAPAAAAAPEAKTAEAVPAAAPEAKPAEAAPAPAAETKTADAAPAAAPEAKPAEAAPAAAAPEAKPVEAAPAPAAPAAAAAPAAGASDPDNAAVQAAAKEAGVAFKDGRYRNNNNEPVPVVTKDYKVDWATWQGFRRYHDACHVCHGPNALGSTFAPSLGESLKTMDYATFYGTVVGGRVVNRAGTSYVMPSFGEDKNIMCYLDDIYTYIKARSNNMASEGKSGMPAGRPNGREDISPEAKKAASDCTG